MAQNLNERMLSDNLIASEQEKKAFVIEREPINGQQRPKVTTPKPVNGQQPLKSPPPTEEARKVPVNDSRWVALRRCLLVLAPIPITAALITLQFVHVIYISARDRYISEVQNALQLAAGAYGTLIVASVSAIALHRIRYELAEGDGVALGYLLAGYQLNNLTTLLSKEFWTGSYAKNRGSTRLHHLSLVGLVGLCMFLAHYGQSMGAMLFVPKPGWQAINLKQKDLYLIEAYIANRSELYPRHLTQLSLPDGSCLSSSALQNESCPAGGYSTILETLPNWNAEYLGLWNLTFFNDDVGRDVVSVPLNITQLDTAITSSPQHVFARSLANYFQWPHEWKLTLTGINNTPLLMPLVQVQCAPMSSNSSTIDFPYSSLLYAPFTYLPNTTNWTLNASEFPPNLGKPVQFSWANLSGINTGPSLGAVIRLSQLPSNLTNSTVTDGSTTVQLSNETIFACTIDARWAPVKLYFQPFVDGTVHPDNVYPDVGTPNISQTQIDPTWAESLNLPIPGTDLTAMETLIQSIVAKDLEDPHNHDSALFLPELAVSLGLTITDGLARIGWQERFAFTSKQGTDTLTLTTISDGGQFLDTVQYSPDQTRNWLHLEWTEEHYGYGYSATTITSKVAIAVLLLHSALAIGHTIVVCFPKKVWTSDSWGTIGGLIVLAMNSRPDERLMNMSAGIKLKRSWQEFVKIREVSEENLELLVAGESDDEKGVEKQGEKLKPGKFYGTDLGN